MRAAHIDFTQFPHPRQVLGWIQHQQLHIRHPLPQGYHLAEQKRRITRDRIISQGTLRLSGTIEVDARQRGRDLVEAQDIAPNQCIPHNERIAQRGNRGGLLNN